MLVARQLKISANGNRKQQKQLVGAKICQTATTAANLKQNIFVEFSCDFDICFYF